MKKLVNKNSLPKFERLFLSYLSQSKLGEKNKLNLGLKLKSTDSKVQPKLQISQKSIIELKHRFNSNNNQNI